MSKNDEIFVIARSSNEGSGSGSKSGMSTKSGKSAKKGEKSLMMDIWQV